MAGRSKDLKVALFDDWTPETGSPSVQTIEVYSNCQQVEAMLNGRSLGTLPLNQDAAPRRWPVQYAPGEVRAMCRDAGANNPSDSLRTADAAARIELAAGSPEVGSAFDDMT